MLSSQFPDAVTVAAGAGVAVFDQLTPFRRDGWNVRSRRNLLFCNTNRCRTASRSIYLSPHSGAVRLRRVLLAAAPPYAGQDRAHARGRAQWQSAQPRRTYPVKPLQIITHARALASAAPQILIAIRRSFPPGSSWSSTLLHALLSRKTGKGA